MADDQLRQIREAQARRYQSLPTAERPRLRTCDDCGSDVYSKKVCPRTGYYHDRGERPLVGAMRLAKGQRQVASRELMGALDASRVKWQAARLSSVKVDSGSIGIFQSYTMERQWRSMHYGIMYGTFDANAGVAYVHAIHEPEQESSEEGFRPLPDPYGAVADAIANAFDLHPVGIVCTHAQRDPDQIVVSSTELLMTARLASVWGPHCVLITVGPNQELQAIHAVAWQLSEQAIELFRLGIFSSTESNPAVVQSSIPLEVAQEVDDKGKRHVVTKEPSVNVDCRWMIGHLAIESFSSDVLSSRFMRLSRPGAPPPTLANLKAFLDDPKRRSLTFDLRIADFHALLFLGVHIFDIKDDMPLLLAAVRKRRAKELVNFESILAEYLRNAHA